MTGNGKRFFTFKNVTRGLMCGWRGADINAKLD